VKRMCRYPGCTRQVPRTDDKLCVRHDGQREPLSCDCETPQPNHNGQCAGCKRIVTERLPLPKETS